MNKQTVSVVFEWTPGFSGKRFAVVGSNGEFGSFVYPKAPSCNNDDNAVRCIVSLDGGPTACCGGSRFGRLHPDQAVLTIDSPSGRFSADCRIVPVEAW